MIEVADDLFVFEEKEWTQEALDWRVGPERCWRSERHAVFEINLTTGRVLLGQNPCHEKYGTFMPFSFQTIDNDWGFVVSRWEFSPLGLEIMTFLFPSLHLKDGWWHINDYDRIIVQLAI